MTKAPSASPGVGSVLLLTAGFWAQGCTLVGGPAPESVARAGGPAGWIETGVASWYGEPFHGRTTASGETYDMDDLTAAHQTLPFGTLVRVENLDNGRVVTVRINDRGPFAKDRILDVSRRAARELDMLGPGTARVRVTVLGDAGSGHVLSPPLENIHGFGSFHHDNTRGIPVFQGVTQSR